MRQTRRTLGLALAAMAVLGVPTAASAQDASWELKVVIPKPKVAPTPPPEGEKPKEEEPALEEAPILRAAL